MKSGSRSNALLVELLIVVMFFMLTTTVLLEVFAKASNLSNRSKLLTVSMIQAQNVADRLYAAEDADECLLSLGFEKQEGSWILEKDGYRMEAVITPEEDEAGDFYRQSVKVTATGEELYTLPCSRWEVKP